MSYNFCQKCDCRPCECQESPKEVATVPPVVAAVPVVSDPLCQMIRPRSWTIGGIQCGIDSGTDSVSFIVCAAEYTNEGMIPGVIIDEIARQIQSGCKASKSAERTEDAEHE